LQKASIEAFFCLQEIEIWIEAAMPPLPNSGLLFSSGIRRIDFHHWRIESNTGTKYDILVSGNITARANVL